MIIKEGKTYEYILLREREKKEPTIFIIQEMNVEIANQIDDETTMFDRRGQTRLLVGSAKWKKLERCLVGWKNLKNDKGEELPCTSENKLKLPAYVQEELVGEINRISILNEEEEKN